MTRATVGALVLAQAQGAPPNPLGGLISFLPIILILIVFFYMMHRSEKKRQRQRQELIDSVQPRDKVVTIGGIYGRVVSIKENTVVLRVDEDKDVRVTVSKSAINRKATDKETEGETV